MHWIAPGTSTMKPETPQPGDGSQPIESVGIGALLPDTSRTGKAPGIEHDELTQLGSSDKEVTVTCIDYSPSQVELREVEDIPDFLSRHRPEWSSVRWISIEGLTNMEVIRGFAEKYELHPLAVEDVLHLGQRSKVEDYPASEEHPGRLFIIAHRVRMQGSEPRTEQISFFLGRKTVISFQEGPGELFAPIVHRIQSKDSRIRRNDASFLLYSLLDAIIDQFFPVMERISACLEELEDAVLGGNNSTLLKQIHHTKRNLTILRRVAWPMRELINQLVRDAHECLSDTTRTYLRDLYDNLLQVLDLLETYREFVTSLTETYMSAVSQRLNDIMKTLTIISTIFVPLTFFAGVYGMNMPIPENESGWAYPLFWLFSLTLAAVMLYLFRRRGWL